MTFDDVRRIGLAMPGVEEGTSWGTAALQSRGHMLLRLKEDGETLVIMTTFEEREEMISSDPETYFMTDHYRDYPAVLVSLARIHPDAMRDLIGRAIRLTAAKPPKSKRAPRKTSR